MKGPLPDDRSSHLELVNPRTPLALAKSMVVALQLFGTRPLVDPRAAATLMFFDSPLKDFDYLINEIK